MTRLLLTLFLLCLTLGGSAQTPRILRLQLVDSKTTAPISDAGCIITGTQVGSLSNADGLSILPMEGDSVSITIFHIKYNTKTITLPATREVHTILLDYNKFEIERQQNVKNNNPTLLKTIDNKRFIKGRVVSAETGEPMGDATILICGTNIGAISKTTGEFTIPHWFKNDVIALEISYLSKKTIYLILNLKYKTNTVKDPIKLESGIAVM